MIVETLISCMNRQEYSIIKNENLEFSNAIVVNQIPDGNGEIFELNEKHRVINTDTKGLSVSRNIAKRNARGDICVIADDDERFFDNAEDLISREYIGNPKADIIIFKVKNLNKRYFKKAKKLGKFDVFKISSVQITFKTQSVKDIFFDEKMGAGTGNGDGEEVKFLTDCLKKKLKIYYVPIEIAELLPSVSSWRKPVDEVYFYNRGATTRHTFGFLTAVIYAFYYVVAKRKAIKKTMSPFSALRATLKGIRENKLK